MKVAEMPARPLLSASVVVYKTPVSVLRRTLESLEAATRSLGPTLVTLVDNASGESYRAQLQAMMTGLQQRDDYHLLLLPACANRGYGAGHNLALESGAGEFHLVLNPDVELGEDCLRVGLDYLRREPEAVLLNPRAVGSAGTQEFLCKRYPSVLVLALRALAPQLGKRLLPRRMAQYEMRELAQAVTPQPVALASGCCMLMRGEVFVRAGAFDEQFFLYFEDFDLSLRIGQWGRVLYHPGMHIVHHGGYAARKGLRHVWLFARSGWRFFRLHGWRWI